MKRAAELSKKQAKEARPKKKRDIDDTIIDDAYARIKKAIDYFQKKMQGFGFDVGVQIQQNRDDSIDAESTVLSIPRGVTALTTLIRMEKSTKRIGPKALPKGTWISIGFRWTFRDEKELYKRYKGMVTAGAFPQRATKQKVPINYATARKIARNVEKKRRVKPGQIYLRLHWNLEDKRPEHLR